jgi:hypothetical protein
MLLIRERWREWAGQFSSISTNGRDATEEPQGRGELKREVC